MIHDAGKFSGTIPDQLSSLKQLEHLYVFKNMGIKGNRTAQSLTNNAYYRSYVRNNSSFLLDTYENVEVWHRREQENLGHSPTWSENVDWAGAAIRVS